MFAKRLKKLRVNNGYSQAKLAQLLGCTQQAIARWETEKTSPDNESLVKSPIYFVFQLIICSETPTFLYLMKYLYLPP